jgi:hypothetical protein
MPGGRHNVAAAAGPAPRLESSRTVPTWPGNVTSKSTAARCGKATSTTVRPTLKLAPCARNVKEEVVVGRNRDEAALTRGVDRAAKTRERLPFVAELHQRQMKAKFQTGPILSPHAHPTR